METPIMIVLKISGLSAQTAIPKLLHTEQRIKVTVEYKDVREHVKTITDTPYKHCGDAAVL